MWITHDRPEAELQRLQRQRRRRARENTWFFACILALALIILLLTGCQSPDKRAALLRQDPDAPARLRRRVAVNLLEARALALERPAERAIALLDNAAFDFELDADSRRYLTQTPIDLRVRSYLIERFRHNELGRRRSRIQIEPLTDRLFRFTVPATRPGQSLIEISPQQP